MGIVCVGQCGYDMIFCIPGRITEDVKARIAEKYELAGGPAACATALTGLWGAPTRLVSRVGDDLFGEATLRALRRFGVDTGYVKQFAGAESSRSVIIRHCDNGNRTGFNYPGTLGGGELPLPDAWDVLLLDGHEPETSWKALAARPEAVSILDGGTAREETLRLAGAVDYLVCSEVFASGFCGESIRLEQPERLADIFERLGRLAPHVAVTLGERGLVYQEEGHLYHMPAFAVDTADTLGAGDIFHGAFAYGLHEKLGLAEALRLASASAAMSVGKIGGMSSIPELSQVQAFLKDRDREGRARLLR